MTTKPACFIALLLAAGAASAAPIYRCGSTYSQTPCAQGGKVVEATDPRSAAQRAEARRISAAERKAAAEQERALREAEKSATPAAAGTLSAAPAASAPAAGKGKRSPATTKDFVAGVPKAGAK
jgi:hypothetical protein